MLRKTLIVAGLAAFALSAAPMIPAGTDALGARAEARTYKKKYKKSATSRQNKVTYDSRTRSYMTSGDYKYRYGR